MPPRLTRFEIQTQPDENVTLLGFAADGDCVEIRTTDVNGDALCMANALELAKELHAANEPPVRMALANVRADRVSEVEAFLPRNYVAKKFYGQVLITGIDNHGWTLDAYVIPRLASGLYAAQEVTEHEVAQLRIAGGRTDIVPTDELHAIRSGRVWTGKA